MSHLSNQRSTQSMATVYLALELAAAGPSRGGENTTNERFLFPKTSSLPQECFFDGCL